MEVFCLLFSSLDTFLLPPAKIAATIFWAALLDPILESEFHDIDFFKPKRRRDEAMVSLIISGMVLFIEWMGQFLVFNYDPGWSCPWHFGYIENFMYETDALCWYFWWLKVGIRHPYHSAGKWLDKHAGHCKSIWSLSMKKNIAFNYSHYCSYSHACRILNSFYEKLSTWPDYEQVIVSRLFLPKKRTAVLKACVVIIICDWANILLIWSAMEHEDMEWYTT